MLLPARVNFFTFYFEIYGGVNLPSCAVWSLLLKRCCLHFLLTVLEDAAGLGRRIRPCRSLSPKGGILWVNPTAERRPFKSSSDKVIKTNKKKRWKNGNALKFCDLNCWSDKCLSQPFSNHGALWSCLMVVLSLAWMPSSITF